MIIKSPTIFQKLRRSFFCCKHIQCHRCVTNTRRCIIIYVSDIIMYGIVNCLGAIFSGCIAIKPHFSLFMIKMFERNKFRLNIEFDRNKFWSSSYNKLKSSQLLFVQIVKKIFVLYIYPLNHT